MPFGWPPKTLMLNLAGIGLNRAWAARQAWEGWGLRSAKQTKWQNKPESEGKRLLESVFSAVEERVQVLELPFFYPMQVLTLVFRTS